MRTLEQEVLKKIAKKSLFVKLINIQSIISLGPPQAGVEKEEIDRIADKIIRKSKWSTTGVSFLTGMPGGFAMAATLPADILQFYLQAFILLQKLMFLYHIVCISF